MNIFFATMANKITNNKYLFKNYPPWLINHNCIKTGFDSKAKKQHEVQFVRRAQKVARFIIHLPFESMA